MDIFLGAYKILLHKTHQFCFLVSIVCFFCVLATMKQLFRLSHLRMKQIFGICCLIFPILAFGQNSQKVILQNQSLTQCIEYAMAKSSTITNNKIDEQIQQAKIAEGRANYLPQVHANIAMQNNLAIQKTFFDGSQFNPNLPSNSPIAANLQLPYAGQASITATQILFSGNFLVGKQTANIYAELAQKNTKQTESELKYAISKAYYTVLLQEERIKLANQNLKNIEELLQSTKSMFDNGTIEKLEVYKMEVRFANIQTEIDKLKQLTELAISLLKFQMGLLPEDELTIAENINNLATQAETIDLTTQNQAFAYETRMDFAKMESQKKLQNLAIQANKVAYLPSVFMYANAGTSVGAINFGDAWLPKNWYGFFSIGLSIQIPIFDGFQKSYIGQQHSLSLQKTENILGQMKRLIDFEQRQAKVTLHNALASLKNQEKNKALATEVLKITKIKYKEGTNSNTEVLLAESAYREAENNYFSALFEVLLAKIEVEKVSGKI